MNAPDVVKDHEMPILRERWERLMYDQQLSYIKRATGISDLRMVEGYAAMSLDELRNELVPRNFTRLCNLVGD